MEEALHTLRARVRPPGMPLPQLFHNLFPAPRGFLNRESLWDELVRLFDLEEEVTWLACCAMDPNGMGLDFAAFAAFMQQVRESHLLCVGCGVWVWVGTSPVPRHNFSHTLLQQPWGAQLSLAVSKSCLCPGSKSHSTTESLCRKAATCVSKIQGAQQGAVHAVCPFALVRV